MTVFLALLAVLVPASVALVGYWMKQQSESRLRHDQDREDQRLLQQQKDEAARLKLEAAMRAAELFRPTDDSLPNSATTASGLLALTELDRADLAVALLVDLWSVESQVPRSIGDLRAGDGQRDPDRDSSSGQVSTETAIIVISEALGARNNPGAQLVAAELLCRNATRLDPCQSLNWPSVIEGGWIPGLTPRAKLLIMEGLIRMTLSAPPSENALRSLVVRLYGVWDGDPKNPRVRGCVGTLMDSVLPAVERLEYSDFIQGPKIVTREQLEEAARSKSSNPDGFLERVVERYSALLADWSRRCVVTEYAPMSLATAAAS
jgi:hypothetical protein